MEVQNKTSQKQVNFYCKATERRLAKKHLGGQTILYDEEKNIIYAFISEPFYSAGKVFNWRGRTVGLSLNSEILDFARTHGAMIKVYVATQPNKLYSINPDEWLKFSREHGSIQRRKGITLHVVQWSENHFVAGDDPEELADVLEVFGVRS